MSSANAPERAVRIRVWLIAMGLGLSAVLHVVLFWPVFSAWLQRPMDPVKKKKPPLELTFKSEPPTVDPKPAPKPPAPKLASVPSKRPVAMRPRPQKPEKKKLLAQLTPKPMRRPRLLRPRPRLRRPPPPKPRPRPKPKKKVKKKKRKKLPKPPKELHLKMVDQDWKKHEIPPKDAKYLAAKSRNVKKQTRARRTNLDKHHNKTQLSPKPKKRIGSLTRDTRTASRIPRKAVQERKGAVVKGPKPRPRKVATKKAQPEQTPQKATLLTMRNRKRNQDQKVLRPEPVKRAPNGLLKRNPMTRRTTPHRVANRSVKPRPARKRLKLRLTPKDADKIFGKQWAAEWKKRHARRGSKGSKTNKRWKRIKAALENYIPEVKEGNQTALKTRAHPFARYIARMHRKIHPRWGNGFLVDLDRLPATDGFNDYKRWTKLEIVLNRRGQVIKVGIVKPSGYLPYDVAALDVVFAAGPFGAPPQAILSYNGKVYMHWEFWRNHRQCGTFGANPFILAKPKNAPVDRGVGKVKKSKQRLGRALRRRGKRVRSVVRSRAARASRRAAKQLARTLDGRARAPAVAWLVALMQGKTDKMLTVSKLPFRASGKIVARKASQLKKVFQTLIDENPKRRIQGHPTLLTASGLRTRLGSLPRGVRPGSPNLFVVTKLGRTDVVIILGRGSAKRWQVVGLAR